MKYGVVAKDGEFIPIETEEEKEYLQELFEIMILDLELEEDFEDIE